MKMYCPHCRKEYEVDPNVGFWHQEVTCSQCGKDFVAMTDQERAVEERRRKERTAATVKRVKNIVITLVVLILLVNGAIIGFGFFENRSSSMLSPAAEEPTSETSDETPERTPEGSSTTLLLAPDDVDYENFTPTQDEALLKRAYEDLKKLWQDTDVYRLGENIRNRPMEAAKDYFKRAEEIRQRAKKEYSVRIVGYTWYYNSNYERQVKQLLQECDEAMFNGNRIFAQVLEEVRNSRKETVNKFVNRYNTIMRSIDCPMLKRSIVNDIYTLVVNDESDAASVLEQLIKFNQKLEQNKDNLPELCRMMGRDFFTIEEKEALAKKWFGVNWRTVLEKNKKDEYQITKRYFKTMIDRLANARELLKEKIFEQHKDNFSDQSYSILLKRYKKGDSKAKKDFERFQVMIERANNKIQVDYFDSNYNTALSSVKRDLSKFSIEPEFQPSDNRHRDSRFLSFAEIQSEINRFDKLIEELSDRQIPNLSVMRGVQLYPDKQENDSESDSKNASDSSKKVPSTADNKMGNSKDKTENSGDNAENSGDNTGNASENSDGEASE